MVLLGSVLFPLLASWRKNVVPSRTHAAVVAVPACEPIAKRAPEADPTLNSTNPALGAFQTRWAIPILCPVPTPIVVGKLSSIRVALSSHKIAKFSLGETLG